MTLWLWLLAASACCYGLKVAGNLVPHQVLENDRVAHTASLVTVSLLAAMVVVQTFAGDGGLMVDARLAAVAVAAAALFVRAPFIVVVALGAVTAAAVRALGWG